MCLSSSSSSPFLPSLKIHPAIIPPHILTRSHFSPFHPSPSKPPHAQPLQAPQCSSPYPPPTLPALPYPPYTKAPAHTQNQTTISHTLAPHVVHIRDGHESYPYILIYLQTFAHYPHHSTFFASARPSLVHTLSNSAITLCANPQPNFLSNLQNIAITKNICPHTGM